MEELDEVVQGKTVYRSKLHGRKRKVVIKQCNYCGEDYEVKLSHFKMDDEEKERKTCSPECSGKLRAEKIDQTGENNPNWKGGISEYKYRYKQRQEEKHPKKVRARRMVNSAVQTGKLQRGKCVKCGTEENIEAHHTDYDKPLEVEWICKKHHIEFHNSEVKLEEYMG